MPERPSVKATYANKKRRPSDKRKTAEESEASGCEAEPSNVRGDKDKMSVSANCSKKAAGKRVDLLDLPGPVPRVKRAGSKEKLKEKSSSPNLLRTPGKAAKPLSTLGLKLSLASKQHFTAQDSDGMPLPPASDTSENDTSEKEASSRSARTTEAERRAYLESHPDVAELEPHRVRCRCCNKWLKLNTTQNYALGPWKLHKKACTSEKPCSKRSRLSTDFETVPIVSGADDDDASSVAPSISASEATGASIAGHRRSAAERQHLLEEDEISGEVRRDAVFCSSCAKWIKLSTRSPYQLKNWTTHTERVHGRSGWSSGPDSGGGAPSNRVREAERKLQLVNDSQVHDFTHSRVTCKSCAAEVALSETMAYQLENWLAHKAVCAMLVPIGGLGSPSVARSVDLAQGFVAEFEPATLKTSLSISKSPMMHAPPSTSSTDVTCVAADSSAGTTGSSDTPVVGQKRPREDDETEEGGSEAVRARTTSHLAPDIKPSGPWGWLKLPWETFKKGFAEGLGAGQG